MATVHLQYTECPGCRCGRNAPLSRSSDERRHPAASLVGQTLGNLERAIRSTRNATEFTGMLKKIKEEYDVSVLVWPDRVIQIRSTSGLCKRTRKRLQEALDGIDQGILQNALANAEPMEEAE